MTRVVIQRIALVGTGFYGYLNSIAAAFERRGVKTITIPYRNVRSGLHSIPGRVGIGLYAKILHHRVLRQVIDAAHDCDLIVLLRGDFFLPEDLDRMRETSRIPIVLWAIDSVLNMVNGLELCRRADFLFLYNREEARIAATLGKHAFFSPLAYDQLLYYPIPNLTKEVDVYFVGTYHTHRKALLNEVIGMLEGTDYSIVADGRIVPFWRPGLSRDLRRKYPYLMKHAVNRFVGHHGINVMTNQARVCLNCLPSQATSGLNTRAFEICGAGGFQLINRNEVLGSLFAEGREVEAYSSPQEAVEKIRYYLADSHARQREAVAAGGFHRASESYTFGRRVSFLIESVERWLPGGY